MEPTAIPSAHLPDVELPTQAPPKARRRIFTAKYKLGIMRAYDAADTSARGALLRREGLYTSHICHWRKNTQLQAIDAPQRGRKPVPEEQREIERLRRENEKLTARLLKAEQVIEVQKNVYALLKSLAPESDNLSVGL
jgi:transposase